MSELLEYMALIPFTFVVGILISASSSCLGVNLVLKRYSLIGDGLSHVAFGAMCIAMVANVTNNMLIVMPVTILAAVILLCFGDKLGLKGDAAIAIISVSSLAFGYFLVSKYSTGNVANDVCSSLFASSSILFLSTADIVLCIVMSVVVAAFFILFYNKIFAVTFDEGFLRATGGKVKLYNLVFAVITAIVIALSMELVGSLLITALIIFPVLSAMKIFKSYRSVVIFSVCFSVLGSFFGIIFAILIDSPVGSTIVLTDLALFIVCAIVGVVKRLSAKIYGAVKRKSGKKEA